MNVIIQILLGIILSVLIPVAISCVQTLITELKHMRRFDHTRRPMSEERNKRV